MQVKIGDLVKVTFWTKVESINTTFLAKSIGVKDLDSENFSFEIKGKELVDKVVSADYYEKTETLPHTKLVGKLISVGDKPFTVKFKKKDGSSRTLRGRLIGSDQKNLGYVDVEDMDQPIKDRFRKVDCRTVYELIIDGVKYERKQ